MFEKILDCLDMALYYPIFVLRTIYYYLALQPRSKVLLWIGFDKDFVIYLVKRLIWRNRN